MKFRISGDTKQTVMIVLLAMTLLFGIAGTAEYFFSANQTRPNSMQEALVAPCEIDEDEFLSLLNEERKSLGVNELSIDSTLEETSQIKLDDMEKNKYYGHTMLDGSTFGDIIRKKGVRATLSEDLTGGSRSASEAWVSFGSSPAHYKSLTGSSFTRVGISARCTDYVAERVTGPNDNSSVKGTNIDSLIVVHLASPEVK